MTIRFASFVALALAASVSGAMAQGFPAPLPQQSGASPFPPVNGAVPSAIMGAPSAFPSQGAGPLAGAPPGPPQSQAAAPSEACMKNFMPLREDAEKRGAAIKAASERRAPPEEACKLIGAFSAAEVKMIRYVENNGTKCGIPPQIGEQLRDGHKNTEAMHKKVCTVAQQIQNRPAAGPSLSEVLGSSSLPEATPTKRSGGSTFDTLSGNVLTR